MKERTAAARVAVATKPKREGYFATTMFQYVCFYFFFFFRSRYFEFIANRLVLSVEVLFLYLRYKYFYPLGHIKEMLNRKLDYALIICKYIFTIRDIHLFYILVECIIF